MTGGAALRKNKLVAVTYKHCGVCGWHYRFYAVMEGNTEVYLGHHLDAAWHKEWGDDYAAADRFLQSQAEELLFGMLSDPSGITSPNG